MRDLTFWEQKLNAAHDLLRKRSNELRDLEQRISRQEASASKLHRGSTRRRLRTQLGCNYHIRALLRQHVVKLQKSIGFYQERIEARRAQTCWARVQRPAV
jgi:hypothetical protein